MRKGSHDQAPYYYYPWYDVYEMYNVNQSLRQEYPEVDPSTFTCSANAFQDLLSDASNILEQLAESEEFAYQVMDAAQRNNLKKVKDLLKAHAHQREMEVNYNPDGIKIMMQADVDSIDCCHLTMDIRW